MRAFLVARYSLFGLFTICNAITCSVAVWNSSLARSTQPLQVDIYLIFLGAFSLVSIFTLIFVELLCLDALTTRVWFECAWVALFWIMELAGGAALIVIESDLQCLRATMPSLGALCASECVLLAFTWTCTIVLLIYLVALVVIVVSRHPQDPKIWVSDVRTLRGAAVRQFASSLAGSPLTARFKKRASVDIYTPQPLRAQPVQALLHRGGLGADYEIEPFRLGPEQVDDTHSSNLPEAIPIPPSAVMPSFMKPIPALPIDTGNSLLLSLSQIDPPRELGSSVAYSNLGPLGFVRGQNNASSSPSPLGDWPRQDIMQQPVKPKPKPKPPPPSAFEFPQKHVGTVSGDRPSVSVDTQPRPRRPSGPRLRVPSGDGGHRLDLYGISNYGIERRD